MNPIPLHALSTSGPPHCEPARGQRSQAPAFGKIRQTTINFLIAPKMSEASTHKHKHHKHADDDDQRHKHRDSRGHTDRDHQSHKQRDDEDRTHKHSHTTHDGDDSHKSKHRKHKHERHVDDHLPKSAPSDATWKSRGGSDDDGFTTATKSRDRRASDSDRRGEHDGARHVARDDVVELYKVYAGQVR